MMYFTSKFSMTSRTTPVIHHHDSKYVIISILNTDGMTKLIASAYKAAHLKFEIELL